ncbi:hypothetical protein [Halobellus limi]|uniref:hypothetical protein n=1 Tax=Halobellus limi TaxID=699433 RepID=UPI00135BBCD8|nr:hypothetical protein [Halobellus limi]
MRGHTSADDGRSDASLVPTPADTGRTVPRRGVEAVPRFRERAARGDGLVPTVVN